MSIFKRGRVYWYHFLFNGRHIQESTKQGNPRVARQMEAAHRTSLAKGEVGIREKKPMPTLKEFIESRFEPWAKARFEKTSPATWHRWYRYNLDLLKDYGSLASLSVDRVTSEAVAEFAAYRQGKGLEVSSVNRSLQVLRRVLHMAVEWGVVPISPKVGMLRGERHRERVVTPGEETRYLAMAPEPLVSVATVLVDSGLRPEECFRLSWDSISWNSGRYGTLLVTHGKTAAARRVLPLTPRARSIFERRWIAVGKPLEGWVWVAPTKSGHVEPSTIKKQHAATFKALALEAKKNNEKAIRPFVLYSLRHTFLTRLGESGCNVWTLARIAGHSSIVMSGRYVHPSDDAVLSALGHLRGSEETSAVLKSTGLGRAM
jgi:integrase